MTGKQLKNSILQWAIQGKLVPQDPNDEPASVLLEKIRAEKERLIKEGKIKRDKKESIIYRGDDNSYYEKVLATGEVKCIDEEIPFEIPFSWEWVRGNNGFLPMESVKPQGENFIYIDIDAVNNKQNIIDNPKILLSSSAPSRATRKLHKHDILFSMVRPYLKNIALVDDQYENAIASTGFYVITGTNAFNHNYLLYLLLSPYVIDGLNQYMKGDNSPSINNSHIENFLYPVPPLREQLRIVTKVGELIPKIELYGKVHDRLNNLNSSIKEQIKKSILQEAIQGKLVAQNPEDEPASVLLEKIRAEKERLIKEGKIKRDKKESIIYRGDDNSYYEKVLATGEVKCIDEEIPFEIPQSWKWCRMGTIGEWGAGATPAKGNPEYYNNGNVLWLRTGELNNDVVYDTEIKITNIALKECSLRLNKVGDVMIAMYGATIGKVAIVGTEMTTNQACCACTPIGIFNWYLFYFLMGSQLDFIKKGEGGAQPNISREKLISHLMPIPPLTEQHRIVRKVKEVLPYIDKYSFEQTL